MWPMGLLFTLREKLIWILNFESREVVCLLGIYIHKNSKETMYKCELNTCIREYTPWNLI